MKKQITVFLFILLMLPALALAVGVPTNVTLTDITETSITVTWSGTSSADGYNIYWGTSSTNLDQTYQVSSTTRQYIIPNLDQNTTYYVQVSAFNNSTGEGSRSTVQSATTLQNTSVPAVPTGFTITSTNDITSSSATFKWNKNTETDFDHYNIYYGTVSGSLTSSVQATNDDADSLAVTGLTGSTRYYFAITAVNTSDNESDKSEELIVDTLPDTQSPYVPNNISGALSGTNSITITIPNVNANMADFAGDIIYYGTTSGVYNQSTDIGNEKTYVLMNLSEGSTWYFAASAYDVHNNTSAKSDEIAVKVEDTNSFLGQTGKFDGGCFVQTSSMDWNASVLWWFILLSIVILLICTAIPRRTIAIACLIFILFIAGKNAVAEESANIKNNMIGVSGGYFIPSESNFDKYYGNSIFPVTAFYERRISKFLTAELDAGYFKKNGHLLTLSGGKTDIGSEMTMVPISASLNINKEILPFIVGYIGIGPDYWYCREKTKAQAQKNEIKEWVGGYHGKIGFKLYNTDENYKNTGAIIECVYSKIDRFGGNDIDIGGLTLKLGFFYQF